ncbi:MAG: hypothetical protein ACFFD4_34450 [Candidatus Odinarchaeota archaeon]
MRDHGIDRITPLDKYSSAVLVKSVKSLLKAKLSDQEGDIHEQVERIADIHLIRNQPMYVPIRQEPAGEGQFLHKKFIPSSETSRSLTGVSE